MSDLEEACKVKLNTCYVVLRGIRTYSGITVAVEAVFLTFEKATNYIKTLPKSNLNYRYEIESSRIIYE